MTILAPAAKEKEAQPVLLRGISWEVYEGLLADLERSNQKMYLTYDRGVLEIMPPSPFHERYKTLLGRFIEVMSLELDIPVYGLGSTTFKRQDLEKGLEPDECYYVQHEQLMGARTEIDLLQDPPPDLAIEMDHTHHAANRESIYAALGVPEIWQFNGTNLHGMVRTAAGAYEPIESSVAFPFLRLNDLERFLRLRGTMTQHQAVIEFRNWIRATYGRKP